MKCAGCGIERRHHTPGDFMEWKQTFGPIVIDGPDGSSGTITEQMLRDAANKSFAPMPTIVSPRMYEQLTGRKIAKYKGLPILPQEPTAQILQDGEGEDLHSVSEEKDGTHIEGSKAQRDLRSDD